MSISNIHWILEQYSEVLSTKEWREFLLNHGSNKIMFHGHLRELEGKRIGPGVYQISKKPMKEE